MAFKDDNLKTETLFSIQLIERSSEAVTAGFSCYSGEPHNYKSSLVLNAIGTIKISLTVSKSDELPSVEPDEFNLTAVTSQRFYDSLAKLGYDYS